MLYENTSFILFPGYDHVFRYLIKDLENERNCNIISDLFSHKYIEDLWKVITKHPTVNEKLGEIFSSITAFDLRIPNMLNNNHVLVFSNIAVQYIPDWLLKKIKKSGAKIVLYFLDDMTNRNSCIALKKTKRIDFDVVTTFDKVNADTHGFQYMNSMYSILKTNESKVIYDACFIGSDKGRFQIIEKIFKKITDLKGDFFCSVYQTDSRHKDKYKAMHINESYDYKDVIDTVTKSNCIIDVVLGEQSGLSLRVYEAIAYNKKLLTNNKSIFEFPQYDERFMRYFANVEDIDWNFVFQREQVDYQYDGTYSPIEYLKKICKLL